MLGGCTNIYFVVYNDENPFNAWFCFSEEAVERWSAISYETRKDALQRMKVLAFWLPILLRRDESSVSYRWALKVGLVGPR